MLSFKEIKNQFDESLTGITAFRAMVKEYFQCKVLEFIYRSPYKRNLVFIGGTKLRLIDNFQRFSEDLDFDIIGDYSNKDHLLLCEYLVKEFSQQNILAEIDEEKKPGQISVFTRYINFPGVLDRIGLKDVPDRKFFIKLDAQKHKFGSFTHEPESNIINRFDVFSPVNSASNAVILATKLCAILERAKGRDFYDIVELVKTTRPDMDYISNRLQYGQMRRHYLGPETYLDLVKPVLSSVDWKDKTIEIEKFLFNRNESVKVKMFPVYAKDETITSWFGKSARK
ncbi:MAG: nucleotidyl transferase AbiEii/AbiGii toxin family protein [Bacteroidota bacterium]